MRSQLFYLTVIVIIVVAECYINHQKLCRTFFRVSGKRERRFSCGAIELTDHDDNNNNDVKTSDIFSLETIRSTLVRQGEHEVDSTCFSNIVSALL